MRKICVIGLETLPMVKAGEDLAELIVSAAEKERVSIESGDVLVVAQKIVSKAEDRIVQLSAVRPSRKAADVARKTGKDPRLVELIMRESKRIIKASQQTIIVEDQRDIVNINAGIDKSNVRGANRYALLPEDPDESARKLQLRILKLTGKEVGVIISDSYSRAFRRGQVNFAIGLAGVDPFFDYRGKKDLFGYVLQVKFSAVADELAASAELIMGQGSEAIPVVVVKGMQRAVSREAISSKDLIIGENEDLFRSTL
jgi:coenzyme F420-0:L-glutamate ligase/coenzyme F420-1:gamma-L-glutamate ligase